MIKRIARLVVPDPVWRGLSGQRAEAEEIIELLGVGPGVNVLASLYIDRLCRGLPVRPRGIRCVRPDGYKYPIHYRLGTSDISVIRQVFVKREYECVVHEEDVSFIIDCGANIGCTSYFFLHHYPEARVIAVEPDPGNFAMCRRNLEPFGERVTLVNSGVWPTSAPLCIERGSFRDGREWSFQVRLASEGEQPDLMGTTILELIRNSGFEDVDLLKIDIESAERELFSGDVQGWLSHTRRLAIELHGPECERVFLEAMAGYCSDFRRSGELTICRCDEGVSGAGDTSRTGVERR
jgi:FkbM family methyltransferase